jgi:predicted ferric reductase
VEGPYGCFDFEDGQPHQIWIGAGIGITPFVARMKQRAAAARKGFAKFIVVDPGQHPSAPMRTLAS